MGEFGAEAGASGGADGEVEVDDGLGANETAWGAVQGDREELAEDLEVDDLASGISPAGCYPN